MHKEGRGVTAKHPWHSLVASVKGVEIPVWAAERHGTFTEQGSVQQRQESRLPEGVTAVHQLVAAALEASLEAHLPADHPALRAGEHTTQHKNLHEKHYISCLYFYLVHGSSTLLFLLHTFFPLISRFADMIVMNQIGSYQKHHANTPMLLILGKVSEVRRRLVAPMKKTSNPFISVCKKKNCNSVAMETANWSSSLWTE